MAGDRRGAKWLAGAGMGEEKVDQITHGTELSDGISVLLQGREWCDGGLMCVWPVWAGGMCRCRGGHGARLLAWAKSLFSEFFCLGFWECGNTVHSWAFCYYGSGWTGYRRLPKGAWPVDRVAVVNRNER